MKIYDKYNNIVINLDNFDYIEISPDADGLTYAIQAVRERCKDNITFPIKECDPDDKTEIENLRKLYDRLKEAWLNDEKYFTI